jgi:cobalt/nickel transport protein
MRSQKSEARSQKTENSVKKYLITVLIICLLSSVFCSLAAFGSEKWQGVDQTVVEKFAKEQGRQAQAPLINTDQGDLLLFMFLLAGAVGGFAAGYSWRMLMERKERGFGNKAADAGKRES